MAHIGDFDTSTVVYGKFTTYRPSTGAPYTLAGTPALSVYKDNSTTQSTTGVTLTADFDSVTGLNHYAIDTSADGTFYSAGSFFSVVITTGTVDSVSAVGTVVAEFTIRKNSALKPTTAARTLDVSAGGEAGVDWANVGSPTTAVDLSGTTIKTTQKVDVDSIKTQAVTCAAPVTVLASVGTAATSTAQTGDNYARLGAPAGASIAADIATRLATSGYTAPPSANENADALLDRANAIETGSTPRGAFRLMLAALAGKVSGAGTGTEVFRNAVADSKDRITATVDASGNRTAITTDQT